MIGEILAALLIAATVFMVCVLLVCIDIEVQKDKKHAEE